MPENDVVVALTKVSSERHLPAPADPVPLEAYQRSPTLMVGETGGQGAVQVWSPEQWRLWRPVLAWAAVCAWLVIMLAAGPDHHDLMLRALDILWVALSLTVAIQRLRRPIYLTTDQNGIAVTRQVGGTTALRWDEIASLKQSDGRRFYSPRCLTLRRRGGREDVVINLVAYKPENREKLKALICERAALRPGQYDKTLYSRSTAARSIAPSGRPPLGSRSG